MVGSGIKSGQFQAASIHSLILKISELDMKNFLFESICTTQRLWDRRNLPAYPKCSLECILIEESNTTLDSVGDFDACTKFSLEKMSYSDGGEQHDQGMTLLVRSDSWEGYGVEDWDDCKPRPKKPQHRSARTSTSLVSPPGIDVLSKNWRKTWARGRRSYTSKKNAPTMKTGTVRYFSQSPGRVASQIPSAMITNDISCTFQSHWSFLHPSTTAMTPIDREVCDQYHCQNVDPFYEEGTLGCRAIGLVIEHLTIHDPWLLQCWSGDGLAH